VGRLGWGQGHLGFLDQRAPASDAVSGPQQPDRPVYIDDRGGAKPFAEPSMREQARCRASRCTSRSRPTTPPRAASSGGSLFDWQFEAFPGPFEYHTTRISDQAGAAITNMESGKRGIRPYFDVDDINAGAARVKELGGEANDPGSVPGMGWFAACWDPQGNEFGLWQNDPSAPAPTG
jgi:predicted enzyme related to lactoylglutathione lyase